MKHDLGVTLVVAVLLSILGFHGVLISSVQHPAHLEPLGSNAKKLGGIPFMGHFPSPNVFYTEFVEERRPAFMRNVLEHDNFPAYDLWTDDYLSSRYGDEMCQVELGKKGVGSWKAMALREFISKYKEENINLVNEVPDPMKDYVRVPLSLECGGYLRGLQQVVVWFSHGGTRSRLHRESLDNIYCQLDGTKRALLIDKKYSDLVEADGWVDPDGYSLVDPESVDLDKFPKLKDIPLYEVFLNKGDCLFVPERWYHYVDSAAGERNLALTFLFQHLHWFNDTDCEGRELSQKSSIPLGRHRFGRETDQQRLHFLDLFGDLSTVNKEQFITLIQARLPESLSDKQTESISKVFTYGDKDSSGDLSWEEMYLMDIEDVTEYLSEAFSDVDAIYFPKGYKQSEEKELESSVSSTDSSTDTQSSSSQESCGRSEDTVQGEGGEHSFNDIDGEQKLKPEMKEFHEDDLDIILDSDWNHKSQNTEDHDEL